MALRKDKLVELGADALADILLEVSARHENICDYIDRKLAAPEEKVERFKLKVSALKNSSGFVDYRHSEEFADELSGMLGELAESNAAPETGLQLVASFIETDSEVFNYCDDSSGMIGGVYSDEASGLFAQYASRCKKKEFVENILYRLLDKDGYGVRDTLLDCANKFLPKNSLRRMFETYRNKPAKNADGYSDYNVSSVLTALAKQMKEPELFIELKTSATGQISPRNMEEIARLYFDCKDYFNALVWLQKIPESEYVSSDFKKQVFKKLNMHDELEKLGWESFHARRTMETLDELLGMIGKDKRDEVVADEIEAIIHENNFRESNVTFLFELKQIERAAEYVIQRSKKVDGSCYYSLTALIKPFKQADFMLAATVILRALLNSILERKNTKAYVHGAEYLHELGKIAPKITDWRNLPDHEAYAAEVAANHKRKYSFWEHVKG
ncbi:MAG: DUF6880 family protein [Victivallaceae bacterium]